MDKEPGRGKGRLGGLIALSLFSAFLYRLSFSGGAAGLLAWVALAPLFWIFLSTSWPRSAICGGTSGLTMALISLTGFRHLTWAAYISPAILGMIYYAIVGGAVSRVCARRGLPLILVVPPIWTAYEYIRSVVPVIKFPWLLAGHTQVGWLKVIQVMDLGGVYLLSFVVVTVNASLAQGVWAWPSRAPRRRLLWLLGVPLGMVLACWIYGALRIPTVAMIDGPKVGLIQGNIPQEIKLRGQGPGMMREYLSLSEESLRESPSLIVWPETMYPYPLVEEEWGQARPEDQARFKRERNRLFAIAEKRNTRLLIGALRRIPDEMKNSAYYISEGGEFLGRYDKIDLVPLGEAIPFDQTIPPLANFIRSNFLPKGFGSLTPGEEISIFELEGSRFAVSICYEISFPGLVREARGRGADFLVSISNDAWFKKGIELDLAKNQAVFRAVESRMGIARAANTGISSFVDPVGRSEVLSRQGQRKQIRGTLTRVVRRSPSRTVYSAVGDLFAWATLLASLLILLPLRRLQKKAGRPEGVK